MKSVALAVMLSSAACAVGSTEPGPDVRRIDASMADGTDALGDTPSIDATPCGAAGTSCCAGDRCAAGRVCAAGICIAPVDCGNDGQMCCGADGGTGACTTGLVCSMGRCATTSMVMCGGAMQPCCAGGACQAGTACIGSQCVTCGLIGEPCCSGACLEGGVCISTSCMADADGDSIPASSDCNDHDPSVHPGARERCNGVDDDCSGTIDDPPTCGLWSLPRGATTWVAYAIDAVHDADPTMRSPHAPPPGVTLRGMFPIETPGIAYAITDTGYYVLDLATRQWTSHGTRDSLFPEIAGMSVIGVYGVPARAGSGGTSDGVTWVTPAGSFNYSVDTNTLAVTYVSMGPPVSWPGDPNAPATSGWRFLWLDLDNAEHWVTTDIHTVCTGLPASATFQRYLALVDSTGGPSGTMHISDLGYCARWAPAQSVDAFPPFTLAGSPPTVDIGATFYRSGLWAIRPQNR